MVHLRQKFTHKFFHLKKTNAVYHKCCDKRDAQFNLQEYLGPQNHNFINFCCPKIIFCLVAWEILKLEDNLVKGRVCGTGGCTFE